MLGSVVDSRYELVRLLGVGGMGAVYEAIHRGTGRRVAVKLIARPDLADDEEILVRFQREAQVAARVDTVHIVNILDAGRDRASGLPFIAMELLDGYDLKQLAAAGPLSPDFALRIAAQACSGLSKAHHSGIVHRDIKPANIFLARRRDSSVIVKLLDFGIAKLPPDILAGIEGGHLTLTGKLLGSPLFMSPEQAQGLKTLDHRTDIWSLGAVLYEALAGQAPFSSSKTVGQLIVAICSRPPIDLEQVAPWVPRAAAHVVRRAMSIDVEQRYATAAAMLDDLLALLPSGTDLDESALAGMAAREATPTPPAEGSRATLLKGSPSPRSLDEAPQTEVSPQPASWDHAGSGGLRVSQPARPVTVNLAQEHDPAGPTLKSTDHPAAMDDKGTIASSPIDTGRSRPRWVWRSSVAAALVALIAFIGWRSQVLSQSGPSNWAAATQAAGAASVAPAAVQAPVPPEIPSSPSAAQLPSRSGVAPAALGPPARVPEPLAPPPKARATSATVVRPPPSSSPISAGPSVALTASRETAAPTTSVSPPPAVSAETTPADAGAAVHRSIFNTLNRKFE